MQASTFLYVRKPWYSYSPFVDLLHMTPAVYSRRLRLSKQIVIPERQARLQPCCKFLSLSHIFQHPPVYANRRMFFSFSSWKAQRALCWANHSAKAADFRRSTAFQALKIFIAHKIPRLSSSLYHLAKGIRNPEFHTVHGRCICTHTVKCSPFCTPSAMRRIYEQNVCKKPIHRHTPPWRLYPPPANPFAAKALRRWYTVAPSDTA